MFATFSLNTRGPMGNHRQLKCASFIKKRAVSLFIPMHLNTHRPLTWQCRSAPSLNTQRKFPGSVQHVYFSCLCVEAIITSSCTCGYITCQDETRLFICLMLPVLRVMYTLRCWHCAECRSAHWGQHNHKVCPHLLWFFFQIYIFLSLFL